MRNIRKGIRYITDSSYRFLVNSKLSKHKSMSDEEYLKRIFEAKVGHPLNLSNPKSFNEKLQWLKIHDHNPLYTTLVDKYEVKRYVASIIGEEFIIPTIGVWDKFDDIDFSVLPNQFVLKCTHDSGGLVICKDKTNLDIKKAKKKIESCLKQNYFWVGREWPYKNVKPRIIAEKYITDESGVELKDYKVFNFDGNPELIQVDYDRFVNHKRNLYTVDWKFIDASIKFPNDANHKIEKPEALEMMVDAAKKLSCGIVHVRTDFYCIGNRVYFGELTFYHGSGFEIFNPEDLGLYLGNLMKLPLGKY